MKPLNSLIIKNRSKYQQSPALFVKEILGFDIHEAQQNIMLSARDNQRTSVVACHGAGKTFILACTALWYMCCFDDSIVVIFSPTLRQSKRQLFGEIQSLYHNSTIAIGGDMSKSFFSFSPTHYMEMIAVGKDKHREEKQYGFHSRSGYALFLADEASGVPDSAFDAIDGSLNTDESRLLISGNSRRVDGHFYESFKNPAYNNIRVQIHEVIQYREKHKTMRGLSGKSFEESIRTRYGVDSPEYKVKCLAEFVTDQSYNFIPTALVEGAISRNTPLLLPDPDTSTLSAMKHYVDIKRLMRETILSCDVARYNEETVILLREGLTASVVRAVNNTPMLTVAEYIKDIIKNNPAIQRIHVDGIGDGATLCDILRADPLTAHMVIPVVAHGKPIDDTRYRNIRAEGSSITKEWLKYGALCGDKRFMDATRFSYEYDASGRLLIESKDAIRKRSVPSPDFFDALMMSVVQPTPQVSQFGKVNTFV